MNQMTPQQLEQTAQAAADKEKATNEAESNAAVAAMDATEARRVVEKLTQEAQARKAYEAERALGGSSV